MATTATAPSSVANSASSPAPTATGGRPQLKPTITGGSTGGNQNRRSVQQPVDGGQRRNSSHKPWGANNQQQKFNGTVPPTTSPTPSQAAAMKARAATLAAGGETDTHDQHMHDRMLYLWASLMGRHVTATLRSGARYSGILAGVDAKGHDFGVVMKWVKQIRSPIGDSEDENIKTGEYVGGGSEKAMIFDPKDLADVLAEKIDLNELDPPAPATQQANGVSGNPGFRTDADISGNLAMRERELHRWQPDESASGDLSLEESNPGQAWNQFEANERLFGVKSDFDENIYTTRLDRHHPLYQQREAAAAKIAREIEGQTVNPGMNPHLAEERGLQWADDSGLDEEDKYSGVQRGPPSAFPQLQSNNPSRYTPPAMRAPTSHPTVAGAPHDPAIIASQLVRPETLQQKQQTPRPAPPQIIHQQQQQQQQHAARPAEDASRPKDKPALSEMIAPKRMQPLPLTGVTGSNGVSSNNSGAPPIEKDVSRDFKQFVNSEKERYKKKKADMIQRDRASKLKELRKFSETFSLKTQVPQDLVPILAKDKEKQAEIVEKSKANLQKNGISSAGNSFSQTTTVGAQAHVQTKPTRVPPPDSFAAKNPERHEQVKQQLLTGFPQRQPHLSQNASLSMRLNNIHQGRRTGHQIPVRSPVPITELPHIVPTGPAASNTSAGPKSISPAPSSATSAKLNAKAFEFKPNATSFTPTFGGASTNATPSPTVSTHPHISSRTASPSAFFGNKKLKTGKSLEDNFNPFKRMKVAAATQTDATLKKPKGANGYIEHPWTAAPTWPTAPENESKMFESMFEKVEFGLSNTLSPQPPHIIPHQPHHQQLPPHIPHMNQPPHLHQHHPHMAQQQHLGIPPPHFEQDQHMRQMSSPPSVMPSPSLHNAIPYQQSPVAHHSQLNAMYSVPGGPASAQLFYRIPPPGSAAMMMHGSQPVPYPGNAAQMGGPYMHHPPIYSPQQIHAYPHGGHPPPPPSTAGYPSPGRGAPMMMHQGSAQGTPAGPPMVPYGMQPGSMYANQAAQQQHQMGMMRGQQLPPHHGGPPPPSFYPGHYPPGGRGNGGYGGPPQHGSQQQQQQQQQQQHHHHHQPPLPTTQQGAGEGIEEGK